MTHNQILYMQAQEQKRHNLATEALTGTELSYTGQSVQETARHNVASETITLQQLAENQRHNIVSETVSANELAEKARHNVAEEGLTSRSIDLTARDVATRERSQSETVRHNMTSEGISEQSNAITAEYNKDRLRWDTTTWSVEQLFDMGTTIMDHSYNSAFDVLNIIPKLVKGK